MLLEIRPLVAPRHRRRRGRIDYWRRGGEGRPERWGFEEFALTAHADGSRVLRASCELHDAPLLIRDVVQSVDAAFQPRDAYVRLTAGDRYQGSAYYRFGVTAAAVDGDHAVDGPLREQRPIVRPVRGFGTHALMSDAWQCACYDRALGPGVQTFRDNPLTSRDHRGATGPAFETTRISHTRYHGETEVEVAAGRYRAHHFAIEALDIAHPPYELWVSADGDFVFLRGAVGAPYHWWFELVGDEAP